MPYPHHAVIGSRFSTVVASSCFRLQTPSLSKDFSFRSCSSSSKEVCEKDKTVNRSRTLAILGTLKLDGSSTSNPNPERWRAELRRTPRDSFRVYGSAKLEARANGVNQAESGEEDAGFRQLCLFASGGSKHTLEFQISTLFHGGMEPSLIFCFSYCVEVLLSYICNGDAVRRCAIARERPPEDILRKNQSQLLARDLCSIASARNARDGRYQD